MQLHEIRPTHKSKKRKRVGRGGKRGTYSGRGQKGQKSRAGRKLKPIVREMIKRYPKLRGYRFRAKKQKVAEASPHLPPRSATPSSVYVDRKNNPAIQD